MYAIKTILLLCIVASASHSQGGDIRGVVSDSTTGERIPFATVLVTGTSRGASTNINGFFLVTNLSPGAYEIHVSSIGYLARSKRVVVRSGEASVANMELPPQPVEFSEVVVTERGKRELTEINTSVHVIDQRDIRAVPVAVQEDIFRAIQILPGIVSTSDVNSHFYVRGGAGDQNLIMLDGMKIYNPYHAFGIFGVIDADIVKTTEVYTGAFPPGYGGRLSSVVSMTTREGKAREVSGKANINLVSTKLQLEGPLDEGTHWLLNGRKSIANASLAKFLNKDVPLSFYDAFVKITRDDPESHSRYGVQGFYSGDDLKSGNPQEADYRWRNHAVGFTGGGLIQDRVFVDAVAYENFFEATRDTKSSTTSSPASTRISEIGARANLTLYTDSRDLFFFGFEFNFPAMEYKLINNAGTPLQLKSSLVESWVWFRYQARFDRLQLDGGIHADIGSLFQQLAGFEAFQPRLNLSYTLENNWKVKLSYGRFSQNVITVNNEDDVISIFDAWIRVPENLPVEQADHYVLGLEGNLTEALVTTIQGYYKKYGSLVSYNRDKIDALDPDYVSATGESKGIEALIRFGIPESDAYLAYTYGVTSITSGGFTYKPRNDRRHTLNALTVFHLLEGFDLSLRWELGSGFPFTQSVGYFDRISLNDVFRAPYVGDTGSPYTLLGQKNEARLPSYHRLDASATYRFKLGWLRGSAGLHIINVYDHKNVFYFDRKTGQQVNMLPFFPSITLSVEY